ncbi:hypothetical protein ASPTUDRAFT_64263 [Aspergillus tubingensis CBS 134.48]|uniref:Uncharacterized protein n=1 Tax=Aspergillus tubingensis (strain CBS 134.48) TaxID=767770 RepID=A0A1L9NC96_ASPTC|nr:hypothetical protein ASPTUDRAFT_64263 [Aspergillus tubingensis CBS 134.48]
MPSQRYSKRRHTEGNSSHCSLEMMSLPSDTCKRKYRYRKGGCAACIRTGIIFMFRAWLLSCSEDRELIALLLVAALLAVNKSEHHYPGPRHGIPGAMPRRTFKWCHGMMPDKAFNILAGVEGDLKSSFRKEVYLPPGYEDLSPYIKGIVTFYASAVMTGPGQATGLSALIFRAFCILGRPCSQQCSLNKGPQRPACLIDEVPFIFEAYVRERLTDGFWFAMKAVVSSPDADRLYLTRYSTGIHEYAVDSACVFDTMGHARAVQEDALYGACSYDHQPLEHLADSRPDAFDEISYSAGYMALALYVWGANAHLDLLRGQVDQDPATHLPEHWYARVWHDALFGESAPEELYRWTARTKDHGSFTGDRDFTECQSDCSCPERYHKYGLGATLFWARETWCGVSCPSAPFDVWMFGSFVDGVRAILRCGEGKHSPAQSETRLQPCPSGKHALAGLHR